MTLISDTLRVPNSVWNLTQAYATLPYPKPICRLSTDLVYDFDRSPACPGRLCLSARGGLFVIYLEREEGNEIDTKLPDGKI